jgi:hypothetical protein
MQVNVKSARRGHSVLLGRRRRRFAQRELLEPPLVASLRKSASSALSALTVTNLASQSLASPVLMGLQAKEDPLTLQAVGDVRQLFPQNFRRH